MNNHIATPQIKKLLTSHSFFYFGRQLIKIFISLYIWNLSQSIVDVAVYHIAFFLSHCFFFHAFAPLAKKGYLNEIKRSGLVLLGIFYVALIVMQEQVAHHLIPIGIAYGVGNSMYWLAYHVQNFDITHTKNRGNFSGVERSIRTIINLLVPVLGGYLVTADPFGVGYGHIFALALGMQIGAFIFSHIHIPHQPLANFHMKKTIKEVLKKKDVVKMLLVGTLSNFGYIRALKHVLILFLFVILGNEFKVGGWVSFFSLLSVFSVYTMGKRLPYAHYKTAALVSGLSLTGVIGMIIAAPAFITYIIFGSVQELVKPIIGVVRRVYTTNLIHTIEKHQTHRIEFMALREWMQIGIGGTLSFLPLLFVTDLSIASILPLLILMIVATLCVPLLIWSIQTRLEHIK